MKIEFSTFPPEVLSQLKSYVYVYSDPRDRQPFYVGKGKGNRVFAHLAEIGLSDKTSKIREIFDAGLQPDIDILRYGLTDDQARLVEASVIDLVGISNLTNLVAGFHKGSFGRIGSQDLKFILQAEPAEVVHPSMLITINRLYRSNMTETELYEATRGIWKVGERREQAELAMAVYQGIVREVYRIAFWQPAGTDAYLTRDDSGFAARRRWEFVGEVAADIRDQYVGKSVGIGGQNPVRYMRC